MWVKGLELVGGVEGYLKNNYSKKNQLTLQGISRVMLLPPVALIREAE